MDLDPGLLRLGRITAHECRHTFVRWLAAAGVPDVVASELAGHAMRHGGAQVTARYTPMPDGLEDARRRLEALVDKAGEAARG